MVFFFCFVFFCFLFFVGFFFFGGGGLFFNLLVSKRMDFYSSIHINAVLCQRIVEQCKRLRAEKSFFCSYPSREEDFFPFEETSDGQLRAHSVAKVVYPYRVITVTGPAGSGKTFGIVNFVASQLDDSVGVTGTTNTSVRVMAREYSKVDLGQKYIGTIYRLMKFQKPLLNYYPSKRETPTTFSEVQLLNLAIYWPTIASILQTLEHLEKYKLIVKGNEERAKLINRLHPNCLPDLALLNYIFIDECSQAPWYILDALAFIRARMRFLLGLTTEDIPVFILIGSPTQTQAFHQDEMGKTVSCDSIIDGVFCTEIVRKTLGITRNSVRFTRIKRSRDLKFNGFINKLEYGFSLWKDRCYFDQFVVEDETLLTDPQRKFRPDLVRLFDTHNEVSAYIRAQADGLDYIEEDIYCVISMNDAKLFLNKGNIIQSIQLFLSNNNIGSCSQFGDGLFLSEWAFIRQSPLVNDNGEHLPYDEPGKRRTFNFFDPRQKYEVTVGFCEDISPKRKRVEVKEVALFKNRVRLKRDSKVILTNKSMGVLVGFKGNFEQLLGIIGNGNNIDIGPRFFTWFLYHLAYNIKIHGECADCSSYDETIWNTMCHYYKPFQLQEKEIYNFVNNVGLVIQKRLTTQFRACENLRKIPIFFRVDQNYYSLPTLYLSEGTECVFLEFTDNAAQRLEKPFSFCESTFPEISTLKAPIVARKNLLIMILSKPTFKHQEKDKKIYDFSVLYDIPIQNRSSMTTAKSTGTSLRGVCCVFPRKIKEDSLRSVYVMVTRVKAEENVFSSLFFNYNIFKKKELYNTFPSKSLHLIKQQILDNSTVILP